MIIETKNSAYEIEGNWVRKLSGAESKRHIIGKDFVMFSYLAYQPEVGKRLAIVIGSDIVRTSTVISIVVDAQSEDE